MDTDQPIMWLAATDYAKGIFHEPRFYGQDYNTHMESLFAVPFLWCSVPVYYALPIATHLIFLFPYLFTAFYLFFKKRKIHAILVLSVILCLPVSYDLLNSLPRGFVTGLFFTSFYILSMMNPHNLKFIIVNSLMTILGFFINPNLLLAGLPFLFYIFLHNYKSLAYYKTTFVCLLFFIPLYFFFDKFYKDHPNYVLLELDVTSSPGLFFKNIAHLDDLFYQITFFSEGKSFLLIGAIFFFLIYFFRKNKNAFFSFIVFVILLLLSLFMGKTREGSTWVYGPISRLYLAVPFALCLFATEIVIVKRNALLLLFLAAPVFSVYKMLNHEKLLAWHFKNENFAGITVMPLPNTLEAIVFYKSICDKNKIDFLLTSGRFWLTNALNYGGPALYKDFPVTEASVDERRFYVREGNKNKLIERFLFISLSYKLEEQANEYFKMQKLDDYGMYIIYENKLRNGDFIKLVNDLERK